MPGENRNEDGGTCQTIPFARFALVSGRLVRLRYNRSRVPKNSNEEPSMSRFRLLVALTVVLGATLPASAHFGFLFRPRTTTAYYYAVPVAEVCIPPVVYIPVDDASRLYAQPRPAPATTGKEPPLADPDKQLPISSESR